MKAVFLTMSQSRDSNLLARVFAVRNAEPEVEVERLEELFPEVVALDHPELPDRFSADAGKFGIEG